VITAEDQGLRAENLLISSTVRGDKRQPEVRLFSQAIFQVARTAEEFRYLIT